MDELGRENLSNGIGGFLGGFFGGDSSKPFKAANDTYRNVLNTGQNIQNPFYRSGIAALPQFGGWLTKMQDPSAFINDLMSKYQQSPWAKNQQQDSMRAGINAASVGGLPNGMGGAGIGSTPFLQQSQQNAANISSEDMSKWLSNVLGINTQEGAGWQNLAGMGQNSANALLQMLSEYGRPMAQARYGEEAGKNLDTNNLIGSGAKIIMSLLGL